MSKFNVLCDKHTRICNELQQELLGALVAHLQADARVRWVMAHAYTGGSDGDTPSHYQEVVVNQYGGGGDWVVIPKKDWKDNVNAEWVSTDALEELFEDEDTKSYIEGWLPRTSEEKTERLQDVVDMITAAEDSLHVALGTDWCLVIYRDPDGAMHCYQGEYYCEN